MINFKNEGNNIIYAEAGTIKDKDDRLIFTLFNGFKLVVKNEEIEKLKFENYKIDFPNIRKDAYTNFDKNTIGIFELVKFEKENYRIIILQRISDTLIILSFILYFYFYIIKNNNYTHKNFLIFIIFTIFFLLTDNFLENLNFNFSFLIFLNLINVLLIHILGFGLKFVRFYE